MPRVCKLCGHESRETAIFCSACGKSLTDYRLCPACGIPNRYDASYCVSCGASLGRKVPVLSQEAGGLPSDTVLAVRYIIVRRVGGGGMGAVYQATDQRIQGKLWAIKEMSDAAITNPLERQQAVDAFRREAQLLATLDHGNLPRVSDYFTEGGKHYLVMDFVQGHTLEEVLQDASDFLAEDEVVDWALQLCDVLAYLHSRQPPVIFRDLKPGNVMLDSEGRIKLIDFGIARLFQPGKSKDTQIMGTPGYAAPEQYGTGQTDPRSDIYMLGATLYHIVTLERPPEAIDLLVSSTKPIKPSQINPQVSKALEGVVLKAMELSPHQRWQSAEEVKTALLSLAV
jgi:serine/threonine-protein kinase